MCGNPGADLAWVEKAAGHTLFQPSIFVPMLCCLIDLYHQIANDIHVCKVHIVNAFQWLMHLIIMRANFASANFLVEILNQPDSLTH